MGESAIESGLILAIESAIGGGSICLLRHCETVGASQGAQGVSRAEELLITIDELLNDSGTASNDLNAIAVSLGPGSFTGLRIGIATAMGLSDALGVPVVGVRLFEALAHLIGTERAAIAVQIGRSDICWQIFDSGAPAGELLVGSQAELAEHFSSTGVQTVACHETLVSPLSAIPDGVREIRNAGSNLAEFIGRHAFGHPSGNLEPIYVRNPRFK